MASLGNWDAKKALLLATHKEKYPLWTGCTFLNSGRANDELMAVIEYRYVKLTSEDSGMTNIEWEPLNSNRILDCRNQSTIVLKDFYGQVCSINENSQVS